ncbi:MAG: hypothetical protein ABJY83_09050 [Roseibium sp.]
MLTVKLLKALMSGSVSLLLGLTVLGAGNSVSEAQTNQLRGLPQSGSNQLPSAKQQLNQNLNRQQNNFSTQQRIDSNNRLNQTNQINRNNGQRRLPPCPSANLSCKN